MLISRVKAMIVHQQASTVQIETAGVCVSLFDVHLGLLPLQWPAAAALHWIFSARLATSGRWYDCMQVTDKRMQPSNDVLGAITVDTLGGHLPASLV